MKTPRKPTHHIRPLAKSTVSAIVQRIQETIPVDKPVKLTDMIPESICDKARRLAREDEAAKLAKVTADERELLKAVLGDSPLPSRSEDGTYEICGYVWRIDRWSGIDPFLTCLSKHKGILLSPDHDYVRDPLTLGRALVRIDKRLAMFEHRFPDTLWGNIKAWMYRKDIIS